MPAQVGHRDVLAEVDAAVEAEPRVGRDLVEGRGDGLDLLVVGRDPGADEPVRRGQAVDHVDLDDDTVLSQQVVGRIVASRPGADDGDAQRLRFGSGLGHGPLRVGRPGSGSAGSPPRPGTDPVAP